MATTAVYVIRKQNERMLKDIISLAKPRIMIMAVLVALAGLLHAQVQTPVQIYRIGLILFAIGILVSGAGALNMFLERELDKKMERTQDRPLPAHRLHPGWALILGLLSIFISLAIFFFITNKITLLLSIVSLVLYLFLYTPLKQKSWTALLVGSIPGAIPVVLGYVALSGELDFKAVALFLWAFLWQVPHFLAISIFREQEYSQAGFPVYSAQYGVEKAKSLLLFSSWLLVLSTFLLYLSKLIGMFGLIISIFLGIWFLTRCYRGFNNHKISCWAKNCFKASLLYQSLLFMLLIFEALSLGVLSA